jgi:hypothetical protein
MRPARAPARQNMRPERARAARDAAMRSICRLIRSRGDGGPDVR